MRRRAGNGISAAARAEKTWIKQVGPTVGMGQAPEYTENGWL